jgi:hypothetical protein
MSPAVVLSVLRPKRNARRVNHLLTIFRSWSGGYWVRLNTLPRAKGSRWDAGALCISGAGTDYAAKRPRQHLLTVRRHGVLNRAEPA